MHEVRLSVGHLMAQDLWPHRYLAVYVLLVALACTCHAIRLLRWIPTTYMLLSSVPLSTNCYQVRIAHNPNQSVPAPMQSLNRTS
jgi:hypothetical protein